jgi:hypothetical protein
VTTDVNKLKHLNGPKALALVAAIDGTNSADTLCKSAFAYPVAIALSKMMTAGSH